MLTKLRPSWCQEVYVHCTVGWCICQGDSWTRNYNAAVDNLKISGSLMYQIGSKMQPSQLHHQRPNQPPTTRPAVTHSIPPPPPPPPLAWKEIGPSGVRALPLAAGINVGGHYKWHFLLSLSSLLLIANSLRRGCRRNSNFCMGSCLIKIKILGKK
jgi:hypothetical protein